MNADLGARLLTAGLVTRDELARALASVPAHGGALAAELVRQGVEEDAIAGFFVADGFGPLVGSAELEAAELEAKVPPQLAVDVLALPLRTSDSGLLVAMADPSDIHAVRELRHAAGVAVVPTVAKIGALMQALSRRFPRESAEAASRRQRSEAGGERAPEFEATPIELVRRRGTPPGDTLERSFDSIVPLTTVSPSPAVPTAAKVPDVRRRRDTADFLRSPEEPKRRIRRRRVTEPMEETEIPIVVDEPIPVGERAKEGPKRRRRDTAPMEEVRDTLVDSPGRQTMEQVASLLADDEGLDGGGWGELSEPSPHEGIARRAARAHSILPGRLPSASRPALIPEVVQPPDYGHLSEVLGTIRAAKTRDDVCRHACRGLAPLGRVSVLLVLSRGILKGREIAGGDLPRDAILNLFIPSTTRSLLSRVLETREPYLGPHGESSADAVFRAALGSRGGDVLLVPIVLSGRAVAVLVLDEPIADGVVLLERAEVLSQATAEAFRRLIIAAKP